MYKCCISILAHTWLLKVSTKLIDIYYVLLKDAKMLALVLILSTIASICSAQSKYLCL